MNFTPVIAFPRLMVYSRVMTSAGLDSRPMVVADGRARERGGWREPRGRGGALAEPRRSDMWHHNESLRG